MSELHYTDCKTFEDVIGKYDGRYSVEHFKNFVSDFLEQAKDYSSVYVYPDIATIFNVCGALNIHLNEDSPDTFVGMMGEKEVHLIIED